MNKKIISILIIISIQFNAFTQDRYKPSDYEINQLPLWAQKMYDDLPNVFEVVDLYTKYYQDNNFEKNYHTQYYKKWLRSVSDLVDQDGWIQKPSLRAQTEGFENAETATQRNGNWTVLGPMLSINGNGDTIAEQSNIYAVEQNKNNPSVWYCGSETAEVYRSDDNGANWINVSLDHNFDGGVRAIESDPQNSDVAFVGSGSFLYKTIDGGLNWTISYSTSGLQVNEILAISSDTILLAANAGLYRSTDAGANWSMIFGEKCYDIKANSANHQIIYLVKNNPSQDLCEFFLSTDAGASFSQQTSGWHNSTDVARNDGGARLATSDADPNRVYAYLIGESKAGDTGFIGVYRSDDGGYNWQLPNGPAGGPYTATHMNLAIGTTNWQYHQGFYNCAIVASNSDADQILVGGLNLYKSDDGGQTFYPLAGYVGGPYSMHVDMQDFRSTGNSTIVSTDGGIYHSTDFFNTANFSVKMNGIHAADYWGFGQGWNDDVFVGGLYHNGNLAFHENYGYGNFLQLGGGEPASGYVNPGFNRKVYSSDINGKILPLAIGDPISSVGFGINPNESYWAAESSELEFDPHCYNIAYTGFENDLWKTEDGGTTFTQWVEFGTDDANKITYIEISRSNPQVMYVCQRLSGSGLLWKTIDGGQSWNTVNLPGIAGSTRKILIQLDPVNENKLWMAFVNGANSYKVFKTSDGGFSWQNLSTSILDNNNVHSLALIPNSNGGIYAFTNKGVFYRDDANPWTDFSSGLPVRVNSNIGKPFYRDGKMRLATYGKGVWESDMIQEPNFPVAIIGVDKLEIMQHCEADTFEFVDLSVINHQGASWSWQFNGGIPATSNSINPRVYFDSAGTFLVTLNVTDQWGNVDMDSLYITISDYIPLDHVEEDFETAFLPNQFELYNEDESYTWEQNNGAGGFGTSTSSAWVNNFDYWPGGDEDDLIVSVDFSNPVDHWLSFDVAYVRYAVNYSDSLEVLISTDCGQSFQSVYFKGGADLATAPDKNVAFVPTASEWRTDSVDLSSFIGQSEIMIVFRNHSGWGNNLYLDNINLSEAFVTDLEISATSDPILLYPNPAYSEENIYVNTEGNFDLYLYDMKGRLVFEQRKLQGFTTLPCLSTGVYVYRIMGEKQIKKGKLVIRQK